MPRIGLIGFPVAHSLSPRMQNAAFSAAGLDWQYDLWPTPLDELPGRAQMIREDADVAGANVTIPHKQNIVPLLDGTSAHARAIGAVNTIVKVRPSPQPLSAEESRVRLLGDNTDWIGFLNDLRWHGIDAGAVFRPASTRPSPATALVLGAGGSARAIVYALAICNLEVRIANRDLGRAQSLVDDMQLLFPANRFGAWPLTAGALRDASRDAGLVVNCTSAGMSPNADTMPWFDEAPFPGGAVLYDLVYKPRVTRLMRLAEAAGARVIGGIGMLAEQGAAAYACWTEGLALTVTPRDASGIMRAALEYP